MAMTKPDSFLLGDIEISIVRSARRKSLSIEVGHQGVKARAPITMRHSTVVSFVETKENWIRKHLGNITAPEPKLILESGIHLELHGEPYRLDIVHGSTRPVQLSPDVAETESVGTITVPVKRFANSAKSGSSERSISNKLIRWYKELATDHLRYRTAHFASKMGIPATKSLDINVRDYKRRWGSCDHNGALSFNWRIIQAPHEVLDYVVVHELAHCHEFNHSKRFWVIVAEQLPDWKQRQQWLQVNGARLYRF